MAGINDQDIWRMYELRARIDFHVMELYRELVEYKDMNKAMSDDLALLIELSRHRAIVRTLP